MGCEIVVAVLFLLLWIAILCGVVGVLFAINPVFGICAILFTIFVFVLLAS